MLSIATPCSVNDIKYVNQRKEYTLISTRLLQYLFTDPNINAQATKCWQLLFNKARFHPNLEITISYTTIAKELGRSKRSVMRYIKILVVNGYLKTIANFTGQDGKAPNTLLVRFPSMVMEKVKASKDRTFNKNISSFTELKNNHDRNQNEASSEKDCEINMEEHLFEIIQEEQLSTVPADDLAASKKTLWSSSESMTNSDIKSVQSEVHKKEEDELEALVPVLSPTPSDKTGTQNNNIKENNNNNIVVSSTDKNQTSSTIEEKIHQLEAKKTELEKLDREEGLKLSQLEDHIALYDHLQYLGSIRSKISFIQEEIDKLRKLTVSSNKITSEGNILQTQLKNILNKPGGNSISVFTFKRLVKTLESFGYSGNSLNCLINEIIFEVKFGSLTRSNQTGTILNTDHAVNIALKLVREKRWTTPIFFKKI